LYAKRGTDQGATHYTYILYIIRINKICLADSDYYESESNTTRDHAQNVHYRNLLFVFPIINTLAHRMHIVHGT